MYNPVAFIQCQLSVGTPNNLNDRRNRLQVRQVSIVRKKLRKGIQNFGIFPRIRYLYTYVHFDWFPTSFEFYSTVTYFLTTLRGHHEKLFMLTWVYFINKGESTIRFDIVEQYGSKLVALRLQIAIDAYLNPWGPWRLSGWSRCYWTLCKLGRRAKRWVQWYPTPSCRQRTVRSFLCSVTCFIFKRGTYFLIFISSSVELQATLPTELKSADNLHLVDSGYMWIP